MRILCRWLMIVVASVMLGALLSQLTARLVIGYPIDPTAYLADGAVAGAFWGVVLCFMRPWKVVAGVGLVGGVAFVIAYRSHIVALLGV